MDIPKFKDILEKVSFLRNYSSLIWPIIIILIGVLFFIPTGVISRKLEKQIANESVNMGTRIKSLSGSVVPRDQWVVEQEYQQAYETDANQIALLAKQSSQRELLSYKIFPEPKDTSTLIFEQFGQQYRHDIDRLITSLNALDCPTTAEFQRALSKSYGSVDARRILGVIRSGLNEVDKEITDVLCREKAESASVYANPTNVAGYEFWGKYDYIGMDAAIEDCWYWQLAYWIIEDVLNTIKVANSGSNSVFTSPVKRLIRVEFAAKSLQRTSSDMDEKPQYALSVENGAIISPHTRRFCDEDIDVVHFNVAVIVAAKAVLPFMQQLCSAKQHKFRGFSGNEQEYGFKHNQITVLQSNINSIDREDRNHDFYRYGEDAVVELELVCEYTFDRSGYDIIKPKPVRKTLGEESEG